MIPCYVGLMILVSQVPFIAGLVLSSQARTPGWLEVDEVREMQVRPVVSTPFSDTVWEVGQRSVEIRWRLDSRSQVRIELLKDNRSVALLSDYTDNTGYFTLDLDRSGLAEGTDYAIRIQSADGKEAISDLFTIMKAQIHYSSLSDSMFPMVLSWDVLAEPVDVGVYSLIDGDTTSVYQIDSVYESILITIEDMQVKDEYVVIVLEDAVGGMAWTDPIPVAVNDTIEDAEWVGMGSHHGRLRDSRDLDYYRIFLREGFTYTISFSPSAGYTAQDLSLIASTTEAVLLRQSQTGSKSISCSNTGDYLILISGSAGEYRFSIEENSRSGIMGGVRLSWGLNSCFPVSESEEYLRPSFGASLVARVFSYMDVEVGARLQQTADGVLGGGSTRYSEFTYKVGVGADVGTRLALGTGIGRIEDPPDYAYELLTGGSLFYLNTAYKILSMDDNASIIIKGEYQRVDDNRSHFLLGIMMEFL